MLGYLAHLAADIIAHNHFIPSQLVKWHRARGVGHLYWEARYDQKILKENPRIQIIWRELAQQKFPGHSRFLNRKLSPTLLPNRLSSQIYKQVLAIQRRRPWERAFSRIDATSKLGFSFTDALNWRKIALAFVCHVLMNPENNRLQDSDPTGRPNLARAAAHRRLLRRCTRRTEIKIDA